MRLETLLKPMVMAASLMGLMASQQAMAALKVGDKAPDFKVMAATNGKVQAFSLDEALEKGPVVVYFYPKAFTAGCSLEAHQFSEAMEQFKALHVTVIGISADDIPTLQRFSQADCQGKFPVGADPKASVAQSFDAKIPAVDMASRVSYLITPDHKIAFVHNDMSANLHVTKLLEAAKALK